MPLLSSARLWTDGGQAWTMVGLCSVSRENNRMRRQQIIVKKVIQSSTHTKLMMVIASGGARRGKQTGVTE